ncbi:putative Fe-Mo cluster-binding NifX family protein [Keratinibaculum paraultunense]|uniref:Putative Fe-Mo cluster-binding NifX family protein n=1 Tax=Keratinibaculum paraultunense TaxID=1278232 RepID=A0A4V2UU20_9FIRM|nr:NifB/NifX family molybdenum-iron cluster-binding protein [Keratinibaculum paraultunense]QQY79850.1 NifB/NifX family molybdenum-iron cluster-binding protein [Keratinibaculum paraultunense]TCS88733.1 putative Fe-Mo cluster-binding NifX family protein [Keratinibaculum paraultunense]
MKIALSSSGKDLNSYLDLRFGRCEYFIIYDLEKEKFKVLENKGKYSSGGAGITSAQQLIDESVDGVISNNIGPNAYELLNSSGIKMYKGKNISCKLLIESFKANELEEIKEAGPSQKGGH